MNTKVCAILFVGATLASDMKSDDEVTLSKTEEPVKESSIRRTATQIKNFANGTKNFAKETVSKLFASRADEAGDANDRTDRLAKLVTRVKDVIGKLQAPAAGCDKRTEAEKEEVQNILKETMATVAESIKDFEKNLPETARVWMDNAKNVLTTFSQKIEGQPTEEDIKALLKELNIKGLQAVAEDVKNAEDVKDTDKAKMEAIQEIVTPLQQATDAGSLMQIFQKESMPIIQKLNEEHFEYFVGAAEKLVSKADEYVPVADHFKCEAAKMEKMEM